MRQRSSDLLCWLAEVGAEQRRPRTVQCHGRHLRDEVDVATVGPSVGGVPRGAHEVRQVASDSLRVECRLQGTAVAQMLLTLAGEQAFAQQQSRAYQPTALSGTPSLLGQQIPDLRCVVNEQHPLRSHSHRDRAGAAVDQHVQEVHRRAAERTHQCCVCPQGPRETGKQVEHTIDRAKLTGC